MDRCYKLKVLILVLTCVLTPTKLIYSNEIDVNYDTKASSIQAKSIKQQNKEVINITNEELLLLSKLVTGEARGESYEGQVAVAAVVINRVKDPRFPNTIRDVIYQKNAFSVVKDGSINMQPTESAYTAAQEALYGKDPTNRAIYFWNPDIATCKWIKTLNPYMRIGNHVFAK
ncbi:cell wall hydrolase [Romboutsia sp. 13368]|uniref:cell wall hydrolase n=1 Tax=Romboutsia sp. 13368 TaxID=2708053 RepID=UPI0025EFAC90|nr:cell wall hydrolase [Romboutsia sp. 13368]